MDRYFPAFGECKISTQLNVRTASQLSIHYSLDSEQSCLIHVCIITLNLSLCLSLLLLNSILMSSLSSPCSCMSSACIIHIPLHFTPSSIASLPLMNMYFISACARKIQHKCFSTVHMCPIIECSVYYMLIYLLTTFIRVCTLYSL